MKKILPPALLLLGLLASAPAAALAPAPSPGYATAPIGPQAGEVPLGSFVSGATTRGGAGIQRTPATGYKVNPTCAVQCITGGVAYGRGPDARLVVTTDTPASIRIIVSGPAGFSHQEISGAGQTSFSADFDLEADTLYQGTVIATDANGNSAVRAGSFRTLQRNARLLFNEAHILSAPYGGEDFGGELFFEDHEPWPLVTGDLSGDDLPLGAQVLDDHDTDRFLWAGVEISQTDPDHDGPCEVVPDDVPEYGPNECGWANTAWIGDDGHLDLDARPAGSTDPNSYVIGVTFQHVNGADDPALPGGYGEGLTFTVPAAVHVTWTT